MTLDPHDKTARFGEISAPVSVSAVVAARESGPNRSGRRSGSVLVLLIVFLGILFLAALALLNAVGSADNVIDAEKEARRARTTVQAIESSLFDVMRSGFLNPDGIPYFASTNGVLRSTGAGYEIALPAYGEVPGVHTWLALTEPEELRPSGSPGAWECNVRFHSDLAFALKRRASIDPDSVLGSPAPMPVIALQNLPAWTVPGLYRDADGDAIPDAAQVELPPSILPPDVRRDLADRLRDPDYAKLDPDRDPDALYLSLKIVAHGAMANLSTVVPICDSQPTFFYPDLLVSNALGIEPLTLDDGRRTGEISLRYVPESNEWVLRNRGGMIMPRSLPSTRMVTELEMPLLGPHGSMSGSPAQGDLLRSENRRWWPFDSDPETLREFSRSTWRQMSYPYSASGVYAVGQNLTTVSYDDQLIRSYVDPAGGAEVVRTIASTDNNPNGLVTWTPLDRFAWDNYPRFLDGTGDARLGRLKLSLPELESMVNDPDNVPVVTLHSLTQNPTVRARLIQTIQDAFLLLLRQRLGWDFNLDGIVNADDEQALAITAAALTANLIDFADDDNGGSAPNEDEMTSVPVRNVLTGEPIGRLRVYGIERQPYITEAYAAVLPAGDMPPLSDRVDSVQSVYAIELYNPYECDECSIDVSGYLLHDLAVDDPAPPDLPADEFGAILPRLENFVIPDGTVIPAGDFIKLQSGDPGIVRFGLDSDSVISLLRPVGSDLVVLDRFRMNGRLYLRDDRGMSVTRSQIGELRKQVSLQRDTTAGAWRFVVPIAAESVAAVEAARIDSLESFNSINDPTIRSVQIDFADEVSSRNALRQAFPTTGSLLLLMRHAHLVDPSDATQSSPFNDLLNGLMAREFYKIDNGRLPVFDEPADFPLLLQRLIDAGKDDVAVDLHNLITTTQTSPPVYHKRFGTAPGSLEGIEALPWGQMIYDYFTALPLRGERCGDPVEVPLQKTIGQPPVDQEGLRVAGRININVAPWSVLAGLPQIEMSNLHFGRQLSDRLHQGIYPWDYSGVPAATRFVTLSGISPPNPPTWGMAVVQPREIGVELAQAMVAYRDARRVPSNSPFVYQAAECDYQLARGPEQPGWPVRRRGFGFLSVGELLNVRHNLFSDPNLWAYQMDGGEVAMGGDYVKAVARMVALSEWVTTKSHVFTVYGTLRGQYADDPDDPTDPAVQDAREQSLREVDRRAIRFQTTVNRLPMFFGGRQPERIGSQIIGDYTDVRSN